MRRLVWTGITAALVAALLVGTGGCAKAKRVGGNERGIRITVQETGGIAGGMRRLEIAPDGRVTFGRSSGSGATKSSESKLSAAQMVRLGELFREVGFSSWDESYKPETPVPDATTVRITFARDGVAKTVEVTSGAEPPQGWDELTTEVFKLWSKA